MILAALIAAASSAGVEAETAIDAERAFAADAQTLGQWTAFRKWSTDDALMFTPAPTRTHDLLNDKPDPAVPVYWWPGRSFVSCDGTLAVNSGPWVRQFGKSVGYFTTVWKRQADGGWKWVLDHGDALGIARAEGGDIKPRKASCSGKPVGANVLGTIGAAGYRAGGGRSPDGTLVWSWTVEPKGARHFVAQMWNGKSFDTVIEDEVKAR